jgi:hypothetical protein
MQSTDSLFNIIKFMQRKQIHTLLIFITGLLLTQIIASVHVYQSNVKLHGTLQELMHAGYLPIPNNMVKASLLDFATAFSGGLFFTVTLGSGIILFSYFLILLWDKIFQKNKFLLGFILLTWVMILIILFIKKISGITILYFTIPPPAIFLVYLFLKPAVKNTLSTLQKTLYTVFFVLIALIGFNLDVEKFLSIRDQFLLSNSAGIKINDFYYKYTLYPAEAFKSLSQKSFRTVNTEGIKNEILRNRLHAIFKRYHYLELDSQSVDVFIKHRHSELLFFKNNRFIFKKKIAEFFKSPSGIMHEFSDKTDHQKFLRKATFIALIFGFPLFFFLLFHETILLLLGFFLKIKWSQLLTVTAGIVFALYLLVTFTDVCSNRTSLSNDLKKPELSRQDRDTKTTVKLLRTMYGNKIDIGSQPDYEKTGLNSSIAIRYWFVRLLGISKSEASYDLIFTFLRDENPNVTCMAIQALARRGKQKAIPTLINILKLSNHWYVQWYAYEALKKLGWKQK